VSERGGQFWTGTFLAIVGFWLIMRTVRKDATGRTLVDRMLG
jgi:hypothetical protein